MTSKELKLSRIILVTLENALQMALACNFSPHSTNDNKMCHSREIVKLSSVEVKLDHYCRNDDIRI